MGIIYVLHLADGRVRYVGQTSASARQRLNGHRASARKGVAYPVCKWFRKHDLYAVLMTVLETCPVEQLDEREMHWIALLRGQGCDLLNMTAGGGGTRGYRHSPESRAKFAASQRGRSYSPETIARMSAANRGRVASAETRANLSAIRTGKKRGSYVWTDRDDQKRSGALAAHNRWHVARQKTKSDCAFCAA